MSISRAEAIPNTGSPKYLAHAWEKMIRYVKEHEDLVWFTHRRDIAALCLAADRDPPDYRPLGDY